MTAAPTQQDTTQYYFISDLHIGGDEQLSTVDFEDELLGFLRELETTDEDAELIVNGDAFGLWEFTELEGMEKFDALVDHYPELFAQLKATGEHVKITFMPGNHDYELACYPEYVERLAAYNVTLEQEVVITREVADRLLWVEHGQQRDPNNRSPDFGNPYANPPGYFVNQHITSKAGQLSDRGKFNWLKDIQSVTPMTEIPDWMISNYFYREMSPFLRYAVLPFLLLFNISLLYLAMFILSVTGIWSLPAETADWLFRYFGPIGAFVDVVLVINIIIIGLLTLLAIPGFFFVRDARKTLKRFGLVETGEPEAVADMYVDGARDVFAEHPKVAVFLYGHTHRASLREVDERVVLNTGTWLKRLNKKSVVFGLLPWVFYPSFRLNYYRIYDSDGDVVIEYHLVDKSNPKDLTILERLLTLAPRHNQEIPPRTVVEGGQSRQSESARSAQLEHQSPREQPDD